ncbi:aminopeptidase P family protein [Acidaminobacter hydrogenoformans]|uniref:Xaa-Pro aminopeptidase n=1 Tax=Acidaminobacter hydrogenoformans DSM 2784 TaxID=1120920 RepID=A0A1G5S6P6_9FIRM|nr:Xaa-Pro peptidase family protein [Acidaminobacter hydrogenoformans]SCZ82045.1 Xaa-Pro aminopeptidase [Acidaminobacter hydrogenoformans DSM 2784]
MSDQLMKRARSLLSQLGADGLLSFKPENRRYFSGFTGTSGYVLILPETQWFITDFRYTEQAKAQCPGYEIQLHNTERPLEAILKEAGVKHLAFEDNFMTYQFYKNLSDKLPMVTLTPAGTEIETLRLVKEDWEIDKIAKAAEIADKAFDHIQGYIRPGVSEREVALELEIYMKKLGASGLSFETIAASGLRSAMPHGVASDKLIEDGDFLTLDFGCVYEGYCSDMTRTVVVGKASEKQKKLYNTVLEAQEKALNAIREGINGVDVDKIARDVISSNGYGEYFGHGLGHGVGLEIHEEPRLSPTGTKTLLENMVVTDEPGIYIPGFGGVRIEDLVVVKKDGCVVLSHSPKQLIEL